jgi:energy-coupling factor transport system ATP-binding protein
VNLGGTGEPIVRLTEVRYVVEAELPASREILGPIDLAIFRGERLGIAGESGSGKTTLLTILSGFLPPSSGRICWLDAESSSIRSNATAAAFSKDFGLVFQEPEQGLFEETVGEDVAFGPRNAALPEEEVRARVDEALRLVGLEPDAVRDRVPETLSCGEARRVAIAGVLAFGPKVVLFDEPTIGLDAEGIERFRAILAGLRGQGAAYVIVSHDVTLLLEECSRILVLEAGRIRWEGPAAKLLDGLPPAWRDARMLPGAELLALRERLHAESATPEELADLFSRRLRS